MTHSTPQPIGDRLKHGPLSGQNLALLKAGDVLLDKHWGLMRFDCFDDSGRRAFLTGVADGQVRLLVPANMDFIGHDADGWIHAPEGGWTENPIPEARNVEFTSRNGNVWINHSDHVRWNHKGWDTDIVSFLIRPATTPATREDGASGADGEREAIARVIDPTEWRRFDRHYPYADHVPRETGIQWDVRLRPSLTKADAILALRPLSPDQPSARERRLEEALREMIDAYGSNYDGECRRKEPDEVAMISRARQALAHNQEGGR